LLVLLLVALCARLLVFRGYSAIHDEIVVVQSINEILKGSWPVFEGMILEMVFPTRIAFLGITAGLVKLFGFSDFSVTLYPLCFSVLTVLLVYLLAKRFLEEEGALLAAFLYAFFPLDIIFATKLYSESVLNFFCTLSFLLFLTAEDDLPERKRFLLSFLAGLVVGFAYLHKVTAGYFCVMFALIGVVNMFRKRRILWRYAFLALGFLTVFCFEMGFHTLVNDDPLYRWNVYLTQANSEELRSTYGEDRTGIMSDFKRLFWTFPIHTLISIRLGFFYWFIFPALIYCLVRKPRTLWPLLLWWCLVAAFFNLSTVKGGRILFYVRQTFPISVPGVILLSAALTGLKHASFLTSRNARKTLSLALAVLALVSLSGVLALVLFKDDIVSAMAHVYSLKNTVPFDSSMVEWVLNIYLKYIRFAGLLLSLFLLGLFVSARRSEGRGQIGWPTQTLVRGIAGFLAIAAISVALSENRGLKNAEKESYRILSELPRKPIYSDWYTKQVLDFHFGFREDRNVVDVRNARLHEAKDAYLVYNVFHKMISERIKSVVTEKTTLKNSQFKQYYYAYEDVDAARTESWKILETLNNGMLLIYHIP